MINENCHLSSKVEIMVSICLIAPYMNIETDYSLELFYDFNGFQLLFSALFRLFGLVWGAVWGISAVSATFFLLFFGFWLGLGCCFADFCGFSYFFLLFSGFWAGFGVLFGEFLQFQLHKARLLCYQSMAIVHYDN